MVDHDLQTGQARVSEVVGVVDSSLLRLVLKNRVYRSLA